MALSIKGIADGIMGLKDTVAEGSAKDLALLGAMFADPLFLGRLLLEIADDVSKGGNNGKFTANYVVNQALSQGVSVPTRALLGPAIRALFGAVQSDDKTTPGTGGIIPNPNRPKANANEGKFPTFQFGSQTLYEPPIIGVRSCTADAFVAEVGAVRCRGWTLGAGHLVDDTADEKKLFVEFGLTWTQVLALNVGLRGELEKVKPSDRPAEWVRIRKERLAALGIDPAKSDASLPDPDKGGTPIKLASAGGGSPWGAVVGFLALVGAAVGIRSLLNRSK